MAIDEITGLMAIDETHLYSGLAHNGGKNAKPILLLRVKEPK